jgi:EmrB/QacA subfamily drug resistance transporter
LVVIAAAQLMVMLDLTIVNIALPSIQRELGFSSANLTWVIDAYVLVFGGILLLGGRAGDLFGRRRMFAFGIALFTLASLIGGLATDQAWLIVARAVQGVGAAIASPTALSLIAVTFEEGAERHRAMAVYAAMSAAGGALGLLLGGILVDIASWRWVMFVNVPIGVAVLATVRAALPSTTTKSGTLDIPGAVTVSTGVAAIVYGFIHAPTAGWTNPMTISAFGVGIIALGGFALIEMRSAAPLMPLNFLMSRSRAATYAIMLLLGAAMLSLIFYLTQFLQNVLHYSPITAGIAYLPIPFMVAITGVIISKQIRRFGTRPFLTVGPASVAAGLLWVSFLTQHSHYLSVFGPLVLVGFGMGLSFVPLTLRAVSSVDPDQSGLASALLNTAQQIGGSLGLAALVTIAATTTKDYLTTAVHSSVSHLSQLVATIHGDQAAFRAAATGAALAFLLALLFIRSTTRESKPAPRPTS